MNAEEKGVAFQLKKRHRVGPQLAIPPRPSYQFHSTPFSPADLPTNATLPDPSRTSLHPYLSPHTHSSLTCTTMYAARHHQMYQAPLPNHRASSPTSTLCAALATLYKRPMHRFPLLTHVDSLVLRYNRVRRLCRPFFPFLIRLLLVLVTVVNLQPLSFFLPSPSPSSQSAQHTYHLDLDLDLSVAPAHNATAPHHPVAHLPLHNDTVTTQQQQFAHAHHHVARTVSSKSAEHSLLGVCTRFVIILTTLASFLSLVFFDVHLFSIGSIALFNLHYIFLYISFISSTSSSSTSSNTHSPAAVHVIHAMLFQLFHSCALLFSALLGRRRSMAKPSPLRNKKFLANIPHGVRHIDLLDVAVRLQTAILILDHYVLSPSSPHLPIMPAVALAVALPSALAFMLGYTIRRSGITAVIALLTAAVTASTHPSHLLGFSFSNTLSTACAALLSLVTGPGLLTVDEWLATRQQLCY